MRRIDKFLEEINIDSKPNQVTGRISRVKSEMKKQVDFDFSDKYGEMDNWNSFFDWNNWTRRNLSKAFRWFDEIKNKQL